MQATNKLYKVRIVRGENRIVEETRMMTEVTKGLRRCERRNTLDSRKKNLDAAPERKILW